MRPARNRPTRLRAGRAALVVAAALGAAVSAGATSHPFPVVRPATRAQAVVALSGGTDLPVPCLTPIVESLAREPRVASLAARRALSLVQGAMVLPAERRWLEPDGTILRYSLTRAAFDRMDPADADASGLPDVLEATLGGLVDARRLLVAEQGLPSPDPVEVLFVKVGGNLEGYTVAGAGSDGRPLLVLDASPPSGVAGARRAAIHQYAHAVALSLGSGLPPAWGEALATWAVLRLESASDPGLDGLLSRRLDRLAEGLDTEDLALAAGNAAWLAFLEEAYGSTALRVTMEELATGSAAPLALDRALRRARGESLEAALREFQIWALLIGDRDNGRHFSFAQRLAPPRFASKTEGLPALSVRSEPALAPLGSARILLRPERAEGGLSLHFEGETPGRWAADILLVGEEGALHRVELPLDDAGRGRLRVPVDGLEEAVLLVRNLDADARAPRAYSWSAHALRHYPVEFASLDAVAGRAGVDVTWDSAAEHGVVGYNVLRVEPGGRQIRVNSVWIPAFGDDVTPASYHFLDTTAVAGVAYDYRIEALTDTGLASRSDSVSVIPHPAFLAPR